MLVWCKSCRHQGLADLQSLMDAGRGDVPLFELRWRCANCQSRLTELRVYRAGPHRGDAVAHSENATRCAVLTAMVADVSVEACQLGSVG